MTTYSKYPNQIDTTTELPKATDNTTPVNSEFVNRLRDAIIAIENEGGIQPSGTYSTIRARLDAIDIAFSTLGGTVSSINPTIEILQEAVSINPNANAINFLGNVEVLNTGDGVSVEIIGGQATQTQEAFTATDGQTSFTLTNEPFQVTGVQMFVNGVKMRYGSDYTVSGTTATYTDDVSLLSGDDVEFWYLVDSAGLVMGGGSALTIQDEGVAVDVAVSTINFTGDAVITNPSPGVIGINITGGGGGLLNPQPTTNQIFNDSADFTVNATTGLYLNSPGAGAGVYINATGAGGEFYPSASYMYLESLGFLDLISGNGITLYQIRPTTDTRAQAIHLQSTFASAVGTGVNRTGGSLILEVGKGTIPGTDDAGPFYIGLGEPVSNSMTNGLIIGYGAAVGTLGSPVYVPFTTELARHSLSNNKYEILSSKAIIIDNTSGTYGVDSISLNSEGKLEAYANGFTFSNPDSDFDFLLDGNGYLNMRAGKGMYIEMYSYTNTNIAAYSMSIKGQNANSLSTGATNRRGGAITIEPGRGRTAGTDEAGPVYIGIGSPVGTTAANGLVLGYGAAVGTPSTSSYVPYTTELARHTYVSDEYKITSPKNIRVVATGAAVYEGSTSAYLNVNTVSKFTATATATDIANSTIALTASAGMTFSSSSSYASLIQHTGDTTTAPAIGLKAAKASATASTADRKRGGAFWIEAGRGTVAGTDLAGPIYFGLGDQDASSSTTNGIIFGHGAAVGTPGTATYVPFTSELGRVRAFSGQLLFDGAYMQHISSINWSAYGVSNTTLGTTAGSSATAITGFTASITGTSTTHLTSTGGASYMMSPAGSGCTLNGDVQFRCGNRTAKFQNYSASEDRIVHHFPVYTATAAVTKVALVTIPIATGAPSTFRGSVAGYPASGAAQYVGLFFNIENIAGTLSIIGSTPANSGATLGTVTVEAVGTNLIIYTEPLAATAYTWRVTLTQER